MTKKIETLSDKRITLPILKTSLPPQEVFGYREEAIKKCFQDIIAAIEANASEKRKIIEACKAIAIIKLYAGDKLI